jgi:hypothetical protein
VRARRRPGTLRVPAEETDFDGALEAMTAPELRAFVRGVLDGLELDARTEIVDALMGRAARGRAGWRPSRPSQRIADDAKSFAEAARVVGYADPDDVSEHLRLGTKAFLAATTRAPAPSSRPSCHRLPSRTSTWVNTSLLRRCSAWMCTAASPST